MSFTNKVVWITGASSGIGEALTDQFIKKGAKVIISSRRKEVLEEVKSRYPNQQDQIKVLPLDLSNIDHLKEKSEQAEQFYGQIDYLVNNGGISQRAAVNEIDIDVLDKVMKVNFMGSAALTKYILPGMIKRQNGHIIVISSVMGKFGTQLRSGYAASKHALHGFFDSLRNEVYRDNINVTIICPGYIKTNVSKNALTADGSKYGKMDPGQEHGLTPEESAVKILDAIRKKKDEVYIGGGKERLALYLKRFFPGLLARIMRGMEVK
jgi:dehydrogenase/reductase SDR family protein 7B